MAQDKVDIDVIISQLRRQRIAPLLEKGLATGVGCEVGSGRPAAERTHGENQSTLALFEDRRDSLGDLERADAVDDNDVLKLLLGRLEERNRDTVALANVIDQDSDVETLDQLAQSVVILVIVLGKVHCKSLDLQALSRKLLLDLL